MRFSTVLASLASLALPIAVQADHSHARRNHNEVARRAKGDVSLYERSSFTNARFTYYAVGLGACGKTNVPSDFIVALNVEQFGNGYPGPYCFDMITISYGGKTAQAQIVDECMGCPWGGLDFSQGLFEYFASTNEGVIYGEWWFNGDSGSGGGGGGGDSSTTSYTHTSHSTTWKPTTTWTPPPPPPKTTSSTHSTTPTTTSTSSTHSWSSTSSSTTTHSTTSSSSSSTSSISSTSTSSSIAQAPAAATPTVAVLQSLNQAILGAGVIIAGGAQN